MFLGIFAVKVRPEWAFLLQTWSITAVFCPKITQIARIVGRRIGACNLRSGGLIVESQFRLDEP